MNPIQKIIIGTRASKLALWQASHVKKLIEENFSIPVQIKKISTKGDEILDRSLVEIGGKGLFLKEIEDELLAGQVDIAVHSMKDVPYEIPDPLIIASILKREDPRDAFVSRRYRSIDELPQGAVIGTTSLRRMVQIKQMHPHLKFAELRGNVDTRLRKLDDGEYDAIVLACAGLKRLGLGDRITQPLDIVSAGGQGAVGIECRRDELRIIECLHGLMDKKCMQEVSLERYFLEKMEGDCQTPIGCLVETNQKDSNCFQFTCFHSEPDGTKFLKQSLTGKWSQGHELIDQMISKIY